MIADRFGMVNPFFRALRLCAVYHQDRRDRAGDDRQETLRRASERRVFWRKGARPGVWTPRSAEKGVLNPAAQKRLSYQTKGLLRSKSYFSRRAPKADQKYISFGATFLARYNVKCLIIMEKNATIYINLHDVRLTGCRADGGGARRKRTSV